MSTEIDTINPDQAKATLFAKIYCNNLDVKEAYRMVMQAETTSQYAYEYFKREEVQEAIKHQMTIYTSRLDISMEKTLKHLAAIAYGNPLDCIHVDEDIYPDGERVIHGTRVKSPSEIPLWNAVCITKVKENVSPDGGITMEYGFESKVPALKLLLERLDKGQQSEGEMTIVIEHKNVDHTKDDKMIEVKV